MKIGCISTLLFLMCTECASPQSGPTHVAEIGIDVRSEINLIDPVSGDYISWDELLLRINRADIVLLGEQHDHAVGHAIQLALVEDVLDRFPNSVVALEMLERDEQLRIDDYMDGLISSQAFATLTQSSNWGGRGGWEAWYQPIIDAVKSRGGRVVAANAPRRYVRLARNGGYARIDSLPEPRRSLVDYPEELSTGRYRQRFWELAAHGTEESGETKDVSKLDPDDPMLPMFRSQQVWDATMAESIVRANPSTDAKVVLLVGQFHIEYEGGVVQELRKRLPLAKIFVLSLQREIPDEAWRGDPPIADIMTVEDLGL